MSGFDGKWLALREPADHAARDAALVNELLDHLDGAERISVLDIGCGTGSTWRCLSARLPEDTAWQLLDDDPVLLDDAERRIGANDRVRYIRQDLRDIAALPVNGVTLVTASALFDLCSEAFCAGLVTRLAGAAASLYASLTYDGVMRWTVEHPLDVVVVDAVNSHQRSDKGFGPALGPVAAGCLARHLEEKTYRVRLGKSPWILGPREAALQEALLTGLRRPLGETGNLSAGEIDDWLTFRRAAIAAPGSVCEIGHTDLLAVAADAKP